MQIIIKSHHVDVTEALKDYAEKKLSKLERFFDLIQKVKVILDVRPNSKENERQVVSVIIDTDTTVIVAKQKSFDMYSCIDLTIDKLEIQLKKHKEKLKKHKGDISVSSEIATKVSPKKVNSNHKNQAKYIKKPMDPEDAVMIMEDEDLSVFVFRDMKERVCVLYPIDQSEYGLITT